ncbi:NADH-quinone oxidoreductase subunit A [Pedobacter sp. BS3]|uniref:NADH-quinone oxidoreductase subunit A n=1 Tax=Pedobacter sp. BS3 TaxID=2567937 RepID=UPI0011ED1AD0|nr:NADH-quinone oxidoreductase subunit A [Pedobacter sp. BS3]TZF84001.1 NADH-quinone oxidoreductase subunit A [Pedobacter sp. BS3]
MNEVSQITEFGKVFIMMLMGILIVTLTFFASRFIAPRKPNPEKLTSYECGENPSGNSWVQFNLRFYVIALIFLLFDVEMAFIIPWTTIFGNADLVAADSRWGWFTLTEMFIFIGILILGLVYAWKKGDLEWVKPQPKIPATDQAIPLSVYDTINNERYTVKPFTTERTVEAVATSDVPDTAAKPAPRPAFKPTFRKPASS